MHTSLVRALLFYAMLCYAMLCFAMPSSLCSTIRGQGHVANCLEDREGRIGMDGSIMPKP
jgi:hypothetical protein